MAIYRILGLGCLCALSLPATQTLAQQAGPLVLDTVTKVDKEVRQNGLTRHELRVEGHIAIGEHLVVATNYHYTGKQPATHVVLVSPVDKSQRFTEASPAGYQVSIDGGHNWGDLSQLSLTDRTGSRAAEPEDVTHVRWTIPVLAPGASGSVEFHAVLR